VARRKSHRWISFAAPSVRPIVRSINTRIVWPRVDRFPLPVPSWFSTDTIRLLSARWAPTKATSGEQEVSIHSMRIRKKKKPVGGCWSVLLEPTQKCWLISPQFLLRKEILFWSARLAPAKLLRKKPRNCWARCLRSTIAAENLRISQSR